MADDNKDQKEEKTDTSGKPSFKTAEELGTFLMDMQGQMANMQQTIDKLSPVEQNAGEKDDKQGKDDKEDKQPTEKEVNEIDALLQSE